jgi:uncharacterized membrane protein
LTIFSVTAYLKLRLSSVYSTIELNESKASRVRYEGNDIMKMTLLLAFLIGFFGGLRSLTAPAMVAWATYFGWLRLTRPLALIGSLPSVIILSLLAVVEFFLDKLPNTPSRTAPPGLIARILSGALTGACISLGGGYSAFIGAALGLLGGIVGCYAGYEARTRIVGLLRKPDIYVAVLEDFVAIAGSLLIVTRF